MLPTLYPWVQSFFGQPSDLIGKRAFWGKVSLKACPRHCDDRGSKTGGQRSRALTMPIPDSNRTAALRSCRTQRGHQFLLADALDGGADPLPHQLLARAFPLLPTTAIACRGIILRHRLPAGASCGSTRRILTPFHFSTNFATLPDDSSARNGAIFNERLRF